MRARRITISAAALCLPAAFAVCHGGMRTVSAQAPAWGALYYATQRGVL